MGKVYHGLVISTINTESLPEFPAEIPCNVCDKALALKSILRKHGDSGSWKPLERDYFVNKYHLGGKSDFLIIEECTGIISENPILNKGFVKKEIFNPSNLTQLGIKIEGGVLLTKHSKNELRAIFDDIINKIIEEKITTRTSRGKSFDVLDQETKGIIENNHDKDYSLAPHLATEKNKTGSATGTESINTPTAQCITVRRKTKRIAEPEIPFFGETLCLKAGNVNNLYRDILELHQFYKTHKLPKSFSALLRMALRLLCETAKSSRKSDDIKKYIDKYFDDAKKLLNQDMKTFLSNQNVKKETLPQLLHTGAHNYCSSQNYEQTLAISIILGAMLNLSHGKATKKEV